MCIHTSCEKLAAIESVKSSSLYFEFVLTSLLLIICEHLHDLYTLNSLSGWKVLTQFIPRDSFNSSPYILFFMHLIHVDCDRLWHQPLANFYFFVQKIKEKCGNRENHVLSTKTHLHWVKWRYTLKTRILNRLAVSFL